MWKWWEESEQLPEGVKWRFLEHKGPLFAPEYERLPEHVKFYYDGKVRNAYLCMISLINLFIRKVWVITKVLSILIKLG